MELWSLGWNGQITSAPGRRAYKRTQGLHRGKAGSEGVMERLMVRFPSPRFRGLDICLGATTGPPLGVGVDALNWSRIFPRLDAGGLLGGAKIPIARDLRADEEGVDLGTPAYQRA